MTTMDVGMQFLQEQKLPYVFRFSALVSCIALGLRSRLDSTDYVHVIVPPVHPTRGYRGPCSRPTFM